MSNSRNYLIRRLQQMDEYKFEHLIADLWEAQGYQTEVTQSSNDSGIDVRAKKSGIYSEKLLIQAKRYNAENTVGSPQIQQYSSLHQQEEMVDAVIVVTTSQFSNEALQTASKLNVKTINGKDICALIDEYASSNLLRKYGLDREHTLKDGRTERTSVGETEGRPFNSTSNLKQQNQKTLRERLVDEENETPERYRITNTREDNKQTTERPKEQFDPSGHDIDNKWWYVTKIALILPVAVAIISFASFVAMDENHTFVISTMYLVIFSVPICTILFSIASSRDRTYLWKETGEGRKEHPMLIFIFLLLTGGLYAFYYVTHRWYKFST